MIGLTQWYNEEISSIGNLAAMEDEYLQRMYASKVVSGMNHLVRAIEERHENASDSDKKHEFELMIKSVKTAMAHVKNDYNVTEDNITYKWNTNEPTNNNRPFSATSQPINVVENENENENNASLAGESLNLNELNKNNENLRESNVLTLNELNDYIKAKTAKVSGEESKEMEGGRRTRRSKKNKKSKKTRRY